MKLLTLLLLSIISYYSYSQNENVPILQLKIESSPAVVNDPLDLSFIISIKNVGENGMQIPTDYFAIPYENRTHLTYFWYEVEYCKKSDCSLLDTIPKARSFVGRKDLKVEKIFLKPNESYYTKTSIKSYYFNKPGLYRVRFILSKKILLIENDPSSEWHYFEVEKNIAQY